MSNRRFKKGGRVSKSQFFLEKKVCKNNLTKKIKTDFFKKKYLF